MSGETILRRLDIIERQLTRLLDSRRPTEDTLSAYREQIRVLTEDFERERADRERMASRMERMRVEFNRREAEFWSKQNNQRYSSQLPTFPRPEECDHGPQNDDNVEKPMQC